VGGERMSALLERCKKCVDSEFTNWEKTRLSSAEKRETEEYIAWGIVHLALYILPTEEYFEFKKYIYDKHGYDAGGVTDGQVSIEEFMQEEII
jgi:hypothetical protein